MGRKLEGLDRDALKGADIGPVIIHDGTQPVTRRRLTAHYGP